MRLTLEEARERYAEYVEWHNTRWHHSGQGMNGKTPKQVFEENWDVRREIPAERLKYIMTRREKRVVRRNGVTIDGIEYYNPKVVQYIGQEVEVRRDINDVGKVYLFSLPEVTYLFDAYSDVLKDCGVTEENVRTQAKAQKATRKHLSEYAKNAAEIRRLAKSPAEILAEEAHEKKRLDAPDDQVLQVVNGGPVLPDEHGEVRSGQVLEYPGKKRGKRKLRLPTDPD